jgi:hypothetical protein
MFVMGLPGIVLGLVFLLTVRPSAAPSANSAASGFFAAARQLLQKKTYRHLLIGRTIFAVGAYANVQFLPAFLIRTYGLSTASAGLALGLVTGIAGGVSTFAGGWLGDLLDRSKPGRALLMSAMGFALAAPFFAAALFAKGAALAVALLAVFYLLHLVYLGPTFAWAQPLASPDSRAVASALIVLGLSCVDASIGPYLAGLLSDLLLPYVGKLSLRYALCIACVTLLWAAAHFMIASLSLTANALRRE